MRYLIDCQQNVYKDLHFFLNDNISRELIATATDIILAFIELLGVTVRLRTKPRKTEQWSNWVCRRLITGFSNGLSRYAVCITLYNRRIMHANGANVSCRGLVTGDVIIPSKVYSLALTQYHECPRTTGIIIIHIGNNSHKSNKIWLHDQNETL